MKYNAVVRKYRFYVNWLLSMTLLERNSYVGIWVKERIAIYADLLCDSDRSIARYHRPVGHYKASI